MSVSVIFLVGHISPLRSVHENVAHRLARLVGSGNQADFGKLQPESVRTLTIDGPELKAVIDAGAQSRFPQARDVKHALLVNRKLGLAVRLPCQPLSSTLKGSRKWLS